MPRASVLWVGLLIGGALAIHGVGWLAGLVPSRVLFWEWERRVRLVGAVGTLLGPEGTGTGALVSGLCFFGPLRILSAGFWWVGSGWTGWPGRHTAAVSP